MFFILELLARFIIFCLGWNRMNQEEVARLKLRSRNRILLIKHSTYLDYVFSVLYNWAERTENDIYTIVSKFVLEKWGYLESFFIFTNCILIKKKEESSGNTVSQLKQIFNDKKVNIMIAPTGTTNLEDKWKSGWWYLAKEIDAEVGVISVDYDPKVRRTVLKDLRGVEEFKTKEEAENWLQDQMKSVTSKKEIDDIVPFSVIDLVHISNIIALIFCFLVIRLDLVMGILGLINIYYSFRYHMSYERSIYFHDCDVGISKVSLIYFSWLIYYYNNWIEMIVLDIILYIILWVWKLGSGREKTMYRTKSYEIYHSLFHILISGFGYLLCNYKF